MQKNRNFKVKTMAVLLVIILVVAPMVVSASYTATIPRATSPVSQPSVGITPEELDEMALDPQSWRLSHDTRFPETTPEWDDYQSFVPHPIVDWENVRQNVAGYPQPVFPGQMTERVMRGAIIMMEFADRPMISGLPQGSELMGNPQVETGVAGLHGEERAEALRDFWLGFLNESLEVNRGHNITGGWLEYTAGLWELDLTIYGPFMAPFFQFQYPSTTTFWSTGAAAINNFGNFDFRGQFPKTTALAPQAGTIAGQNGVEFFCPETGDNNYHFLFFKYAGYCQSPTWQEMGSMMFTTPYFDAEGNPVNGPAHPARTEIRPTIAEQDVIVHPVTREVMPGRTGMDFTGYAHIQRLLAQVRDPNFDVSTWSGLRMLDTDFNWRTFVSTGPNQADFEMARRFYEEGIPFRTTTVPNPIIVTIGGEERTLAVPGTVAQRTIGALVAEEYIAFRAEFPASTLQPIQFRNNVWRPAFLAYYADLMKYTPGREIFHHDVDIAFTAAVAGLGDFVDVDLTDVSEYGFDQLVFELDEYDNLILDEEPLIIASELIEFVEEGLTGVTAFRDVEYSDMWLEWYAVNSQQRILEDTIIPLFEAAAEEARTSTQNPYFQAAPQRYVPWSSWYGGANVWSHATSVTVSTPVATRSVQMSAQGEGTAMAVYSHELGHIVRLHDNDNMVYALTGTGAALGEGNTVQSLPVRAHLGPWNIMARGAHVGYYGGHTRWNIPGIRGGSGGTGLVSKMRIAAGFTDLTLPIGPGAGTTAGPRNWVRPDPENSLDVLYVEYVDFRAGTPVVGEVFGRNIPVNRGFLDYHGDPIEGYEAVIIQDITGRRFQDQTPGLNNPIFGTSNALRWGNNLLGINLSLDRFTVGNRLIDLPKHPNGQNIIDPERWNWPIGGFGTQTDAASQANTGIPGGLSAATNGRHQAFAIDVIDRVGYDSFSPDHGVLITRIAHTNAVGAGGMDAGGIFTIDAHPGNLGMIQFREANGDPYMFMCDHHMQIATAAFRAGVHNNPYFYRDEFPERFLDDYYPHLGLEPDPRPGVAGNTVNEWIDEHNNFHFYVLARNNHDGVYGPFLSYEVGVRNMTADAVEVGGDLELEAVGAPTAASAGNFAVQTFRITNTNTVTDSNIAAMDSVYDILRVTLEGDLAKPVMRTTEGGYEYLAHTSEQNAVVLNNLFAATDEEVIYFDVFFRIPEGFEGTNFDASQLLSVTVSSETTASKSATAAVSEPPVCRDELGDLLDEADNLTQENFSAANWRLFVAARNHGRNVFENPDSTQAEIDNATYTLRNLINRQIPLGID